MSYRNLGECIQDLEKTGNLVRVTEEVDPYLEMAEIHRRVNQARGPAIYYAAVKGSPFPAVSNLFGTVERARYIFRHELERVKNLVRLKADPKEVLKKPFSLLSLPRAAYDAWPRRVKEGPVFRGETRLDQLPQIQSWPEDGGAFITLGQVYTENQERPGIFSSNLGMYRVQISGNDYLSNREAGLHYQIRRDIGIHHHAALRRGEPLRVSIFVGGPPAHGFAAVMYLPEGMPEVCFAGSLAGRRFRYAKRGGFTVSAEADFCITGRVEIGKTKPEGPFGDHLGYYSLKHEFPYIAIEKVYHRKDAVWPFTVVGRPPQEDSSFGALIQEIAGPMIPVEIPGVKAVHAVDVSGVHPLLLAIGSERYVPFEERRPQEILTLANALLGYGPCSLAKYLFIVAGEDAPDLNIHRVEDFLHHMLSRIDWSRDLHFQTRTTMDTLDYTGPGLNSGSKVVMAAAGPARRTLAARLPENLSLPAGFSRPELAMPGVLVLQAPAFESHSSTAAPVAELEKCLEQRVDGKEVALVVLSDDSGFCTRNLTNFLWVTFTRSNPSHDIYGAGSFMEHKHWGCRGPLIIDARLKPHHAPPLYEDPAVSRKVEQMAAPGGSLHGLF